MPGQASLFNLIGNDCVNIFGVLVTFYLKTP